MGRCFSCFLPRLARQARLGLGRAAQVQAPAEIFAVDVLCNERGAQFIQPEQCFLTERIHVENALKVEDRFCPRTKRLGDTDEFFYPQSSQSAFQNKHGRIFADWQCDS